MEYSLPSSSIHGIFQAKIQCGLPFPPSGYLHPGIEPTSHWEVGSLPLGHLGSPKNFSVVQFSFPCFETMFTIPVAPSPLLKFIFIRTSVFSPIMIHLAEVRSRIEVGANRFMFLLPMFETLKISAPTDWEIYSSPVLLIPDWVHAWKSAHFIRGCPGSYSLCVRPSPRRSNGASPV